MMRPLLLCVSMVWMVSAAAGSNAIRLRITGLVSNTGTVHCALHAEANGFPSANAIQHVTRMLAGGEGRCEFAAIAVGSYVINAIHDVEATAGATSDDSASRPSLELSRAMRRRASGHPNLTTRGSITAAA